MSQKNLQTQEQTQTEQQLQVQQMLPQQVLLIRLTELPFEALQHRVELECMENPWLERKEGTDNGEQTTDNVQGVTDDAYSDATAGDA